jgi:hypothetical protein
MACVCDLGYRLQLPMRLGCSHGKCHAYSKGSAMKSNVGGIDKVLRIVAGLALLSLVFILDGNARWWGLIGIVPLLTGSLGWCPAYTLVGLNTCPVKK